MNHTLTPTPQHQPDRRSRATRRTLLATSLALSLLTPLAAHAQQGVTDTEILLGEVEPLTGPPALLGLAYNVGTKIALAEANAAGGINGRKLRLIAEDDGYVPTRTIQAVKKLVEVDKVFALTSLSGSGNAIAAISSIERMGIPTMASIAPVPQLFEPPRKNVFAMGASYQEGVYQMTLNLANRFPGKKWGIIIQDDDYGLAVSEGFTRARKEKSLDVVFEAKYKKGQQDFSAEMARLKSTGAEVFIAGGVLGENVAMVKELEKLAHKPQVAVFWPGRVPAALKLMGPAGDGIWGVDYVEPESSDVVKAFVERAKGLVGEAEVKAINRYTLVGYSSTRLLLEAMRRCGKALTWTCTISEIEKTQNFDTGVMHPISFGPGVRFAAQKLMVMQGDAASATFRPAK